MSHADTKDNEQGDDAVERRTTRCYSVDEFKEINNAFTKGTGPILIGSRETTPDIFYSPRELTPEDNATPELEQGQGKGKTNDQRYIKQLSRKSFPEILDGDHWTHDKTREWARLCLMSINNQLIFKVTPPELVDEDPLVPLEEDRPESEILNQWVEQDQPALQALDQVLPKSDMSLKFGYMKVSVFSTTIGKVIGRALPFIAVIEPGSSATEEKEHWYTGGRKNLHEKYSTCGTLKDLADTAVAQIKERSSKLPRGYSSEKDAWPPVARIL